VSRRVLPSMEAERQGFAREFSTVQRWLDGLGKLSGSELTRKRGLNALINFCKWTGKTPDMMISERLRDLKGDDIQVRARHEDLVNKYFQTFKSRGMGCGVFDYLKSFYKHNYVPLLCQSPKRFRVTTERIPTVAEIARMIEVADLRDKAIIAFLAQSGVREGTLCKLTYGHVKEDLEAGEKIMHFYVRPEEAKAGIAYDGFAGPEAASLLKGYLTMREKGTAYMKPETIIDRSPLFRRRARGIEPVTEDSIQVLVYHRAVEANVIPPKGHPGEWAQIRPHCLRKFFQTRMEEAGLHVNWVKHLMGHKIRGSDAAYSKPTVRQLREAYEKALSYITLNPANAVAMDKDRTIRELRERLEKLESIYVEVGVMKERIEALTEVMPKKRWLRKPS